MTKITTITITIKKNKKKKKKMMTMMMMVMMMLHAWYLFNIITTITINLKCSWHNPKPYSHGFRFHLMSNRKYFWLTKHLA